MIAPFLLAFFIVVIAVTLVANSLVIVLTMLFRRLPSPVNCCYFSLAIADILVAAFAMTSKVVDFGLHFTTAFGNHTHLHEIEEANTRRYIVCDTHHFLRTFACTASILHICVISVERCRSLDKPFGHLTEAGYRPIIVELIMSWSTSLLVSGVSAFWLNQVHEEQQVHETTSLTWNDIPFPNEIIFHKPTPSPSEHLVRHIRDIDLNHEFTQAMMEGDCWYPSSPLYLLSYSAISFYIPLTIMIAFYGKIYIMTRRQLALLKQSGGGKCTKPTKSASGNWHNFSFRIHRGGTHNQVREKLVKKISGLVSRTGDDDTSDDTPNGEHTSVGERRSRTQSTIQKLASRVKHNKRDSVAQILDTIERKNRYPTIEKMITTLTPFGRSEFFKKWQFYMNENKAIRTLGMLLGVFIVCWSPFFALNLLFAAIGRENVPNDKSLFDCFIWLGLLNSAINPFLYPLSSKEYRRLIHTLARKLELVSHSPIIVRVQVNGRANGNSSNPPKNLDDPSIKKKTHEQLSSSQDEPQKTPILRPNDQSSKSLHNMTSVSSWIRVFKRHRRQSAPKSIQSGSNKNGIKPELVNNLGFRQQMSFKKRRFLKNSRSLPRISKAVAENSNKENDKTRSASHTEFEVESNSNLYSRRISCSDNLIEPVIHQFQILPVSNSF